MKTLWIFFSERSENKTKKRKTNEPGRNKLVLDPLEESENQNDDSANPIEEGWEAETILGAADVEGQIHFLIQW